MNKVFKFLLQTSLALTMFLIFGNSLCAQDEVPVPDMSPEETVRMQVENIMMKDTMMINMPYHKEITLFQFPSKELAAGKAEVKKYWINYALSDSQVDYEFMGGDLVGETFFAKVRKMDRKAGTEQLSYILYQFEGKRIKSIYFF